MTGVATDQHASSFEHPHASSIRRAATLPLAGAASRLGRPMGTAGEALIRTPIKELVSQRDSAQFVQVHRCVVVNLRLNGPYMHL